MTNRIQIDVVTGEQTVIELSKNEIDDREAAHAKAEADREAEATAKAADKAALLAKLGITADEAALLLA
jgi:hypothetical protein